MDRKLPDILSFNDARGVTYRLFLNTETGDRYGAGMNADHSSQLIAAGTENFLRRHGISPLVHKGTHTNNSHRAFRDGQFVTGGGAPVEYTCAVEVAPADTDRLLELAAG